MAALAELQRLPEARQVQIAQAATAFGKPPTPIPTMNPGRQVVPVQPQYPPPQQQQQQQQQPAYLQTIIFGPPGTGKSHSVAQEVRTKLGLTREQTFDQVKILFHPDYSHADFFGKLVPMTRGDRVAYTFYLGHLLSAIATAYSYLLDGSPMHVVLVIDELNRGTSIQCTTVANLWLGNASAIFGPAFQLLDRDSNGWSSYEVTLLPVQAEVLKDRLASASFDYKSARLPLLFRYLI